MKTELRIAAMCLAVIMLAGPASTVRGTGFRIPDQDAFATARGEAFVATADNASAIYYNPAGLTQLESQNLRGGIYGLYFDPRYTSPSSGRTFDNEKLLHAIPQLFYSWTLETLPLAVGVGEDIEPATVSFFGYDPVSGAFGSPSPLPITGTGWNTYTLELLDSQGNFLPAGSQVEVFADVLANAPDYEGATGQNVHMQSDLYVDNFTTTAIPEPVTILSLLIAAAGNASYLRRRMAA